MPASFRAGESSTPAHQPKACNLPAINKRRRRAGEIKVVANPREARGAIGAAVKQEISSINSRKIA